jgi:glucose/mannose transport system permease protein
VRPLRSAAAFGLQGMAAFAFAFPMLASLATSVKSSHEVNEGSVLALPHHPVLTPWAKAWSSLCSGGDCYGISSGVANSFMIVIPALSISLVLGSITGFALSLRKSRRADLLFAALLIGLFLPIQLTLFPMIESLRELGLFGTRAGLILVHTVWGLPFVTLLFRNFFLGVSRDVLDAARVDGAGFFDIFRHVMLPMSLPVCAVALVLQFTFLWNDFLLGLTFSGRGNEPVTVVLNILAGAQFGAQEYNVIMAAAVLAALPPILLHLLAGRLLVRGIAARPFHG